jgi:hypothetical protein
MCHLIGSKSILKKNIFQFVTLMIIQLYSIIFLFLFYLTSIFTTYSTQESYKPSQILTAFNKLKICGWFMVFNATLNNISLILWWSVLSVEKTGSEVPRENHQPTASHWQILSHNVVWVHHVVVNKKLKKGVSNSLKGNFKQFIFEKRN